MKNEMKNQIEDENYYGTLYASATGAVLRPATKAEYDESRAAKKSNIGGGSGVIEVDRVTVFVDDITWNPNDEDDLDEE